MKSELLHCLAYWLEKMFDWAIVLVDRLEKWRERKEAMEVQKVRELLEKQFQSENTLPEDGKEI